MRTSNRRKGLIAALLVALLAAAIAVAAEGPTRAEYVTHLEGICKPRELATERAVKGVRDDLRNERLAVAATKFGKAARIFGATVRLLKPVPRPPADVAKLKKWFFYLDRQEAYLQEITAQLRQGHAIRAQRLVARFIHNGNLANNVVIGFGFDYCSFKFSRFG
ncbi:MAG TPA: hypothetical protein VF009_05110 [Solirubrobacterales bacterium]